MSSTGAGWLQFALLFAALAACYIPLGNYIAHIFTSDKDWRIERGFYRLMGIDSKADQRWGTYVRSILAFSAVSVIFLYGIERLQHYLPLSVGMAAVTPDTAWNTAASFVTNTNWQNYAGEATMGYLTQMTGLTVQQFLSAAVGLAVAIAMIRGFTRSRTDKLGNFWVDVTRGVFRLLIPLSIIIGLALIAGGAIDNFSAYHTYTTLSGAHQTIPGGPVGSMEAIKNLGNNGGGFFNTNSAHPFESPNPFTNWLIIFSLLLIPFATPRAFGKMVGDNRQGYGHHLVGRGRRHQLVRGAHRYRRHGHHPGRARRGRNGNEVRHPRLLVVRLVHHGDLDRGGELFP
jgi:potassium-transporting ATPase potassium-binding subunit